MPRLRRPAHSQSGSELPNWGVSIEFDSTEDRFTVHEWRADTIRRRGSIKHSTYAPTDLEDALAAVQRIARILNARRLF